MLVKRTRPPVPACNTRIDLGHGFFAIVDPHNFEWLSRWKWKLKKSHHCYYAVRKRRFRGKEYIVRMHREVAHCPPDKVTHHINHRSLDNRESNLVNLYPEDHNAGHASL